MFRKIIPKIRLWQAVPEHARGMDDFAGEFGDTGITALTRSLESWSSSPAAIFGRRPAIGPAPFRPGPVSFARAGRNARHPIPTSCQPAGPAPVGRLRPSEQAHADQSDRVDPVRPGPCRRPGPGRGARAAGSGAVRHRSRLVSR